MTALKRIVLLFFCCLFLFGCSLKEENDKGYLQFQIPEQTSLTVPTGSEEARGDEIHACWLPYPALNPKRLLRENLYRAYIKELLHPLTRLKATDLFVHVRPFADAVYPSAIFESSACVVGRRGTLLPFDYLQVIIEEARALHLRVHGWMNPYRVLSAGMDIGMIGKETPIGHWLQDRQSDNLLRTESGLYLQPASTAAQKLIIDGARELLQAYSLDGLHIDDYFYPPDITDEDYDLYAAYTDAGGRLSLEAWRREQINALLRGLYRIVHAAGAHLIFSVSPDGNLQRNNSIHYADVARWCREDGYCDWIIPQLYYGFRHETMPFQKVASQWRSLCSNMNVRLIAGLALYKIGADDPYAGVKGKGEWRSNNGILASQVRAVRLCNYDGIAFYAVQFVNFQEKVTAKACQMLENVL